MDARRTYETKYPASTPLTPQLTHVVHQRSPPLDRPNQFTCSRLQFHLQGLWQMRGFGPRTRLVGALLKSGQSKLIQHISLLVWRQRAVNQIKFSPRKRNQFPVGPLHTWMGNFMHDLRFALRQLRLNPAVTLVAVLSLALGIGANTAIFQLYRRRPPSLSPC